MAIYGTSDPHFDHDNIKGPNGFCKPRAHFKTVTEMNETIIKNWNKRVTNDDTVYLLGDLGIGRPKEIFEWLVQLKGIIYIVKGNHDNSRLLKYIVNHSPMIHGQSKFHIIEMGTIIKRNGIQYYLTHYPQGLGEHRRKIRNLCGHIHEFTAYDANVLNIGMDSPEIGDRPFGQPILLDDAFDLVDTKWESWYKHVNRQLDH